MPRDIPVGNGTLLITFDEVRRWPKSKTIMKMKRSVLDSVKYAQPIQGSKEIFYSALGVKTAHPNRNPGVFAARVMSGINTI